MPRRLWYEPRAPQVARGRADPLAFPSTTSAPGSGASWCTPAAFVTCRAPGQRGPGCRGGNPREAHVPAEQPPPGQAPRLPPPHVRPRRPGRDPGPSAQGPQAPVGLSAPRTRADAHRRPGSAVAPRARALADHRPPHVPALRQQGRARAGARSPSPGCRPGGVGRPRPCGLRGRRPPAVRSCATGSAGGCVPPLRELAGRGRLPAGAYLLGGRAELATLPWQRAASSSSPPPIAEARAMSPVARVLHGRRPRLPAAHAPAARRPAASTPPAPPTPSRRSSTTAPLRGTGSPSAASPGATRGAATAGTPSLNGKAN